MGGGVPLHLLALKAPLVVLVGVFVMISTVLSVSCLLFFYSRCPRAQPSVKVERQVPPVPHGAVPLSRLRCRFGQRVFDGVAAVRAEVADQFQRSSLQAQNQVALVARSIRPRLQVPPACLGVYNGALVARELWREDQIVVAAAANKVGDHALHGRRKVALPRRAETCAVDNGCQRHRLLHASVVVSADAAALPAHLPQQLAADIGIRNSSFVLLATKHLHTIQYYT